MKVKDNAAFHVLESNGVTYEKIKLTLQPDTHAGLGFSEDEDEDEDAPEIEDHYNDPDEDDDAFDDDKLTEESYRTTFEDPENLGLDDAEDVADDDY